METPSYDEEKELTGSATEELSDLKLKEEKELIDSTTEELSDLDINPRKRLEFENKLKEYQQDPELKSAYDKINDKIIGKVISEKWKEYENTNVTHTIDYIIKQYPKLWFSVVEGLWLPKSSDGNRVVLFNDLPSNKKLRFIALNEAIKQRSPSKLLKNKDPLDERTIGVGKNKHTHYLIEDNYASVYNDIQDKLKQELELMNWVDFLTKFKSSETTLKQDFWLTDQECNKLKEFDKFSKKNEKFLWGIPLLGLWRWAPKWAPKLSPKPGGYPWLFLIVLGWVVLGTGVWIWRVWEKQLHVFDKDPELVVDETKPIEIEFTEEVEKLTSLEVWFHKQKVYTLKPYSDENIKNTEWNPSFRAVPFIGPLLEIWSREWRKWRKRLKNGAQSRHIKMDLHWKFGFQYDLKNTKGKLLSDGTLIIKTKKPNLVFSHDYQLGREVNMEIIWVREFEEKEFEEFQNWINESVKPEYEKTEEYRKGLAKSVFSLLKHYHDEAIMLESPHKVQTIKVYFTDGDYVEYSYEDIDWVYNIEIPEAELPFEPDPEAVQE